MDAEAFLDVAGADLRRIRNGETPQARESEWLADVMRRHDLSIEAAEALLLGMRSDVQGVSGLNQEELLEYCFRAAGAVGVLMCPLLGLEDRRFLPHAAALGIGMQLTNIARDVGEDWRRSRCYLPLEWTKGLGPGDEPPESRRVQIAVRRILELADGYYAAGELGVGALPSRSRSAVRVASRVYHAIGTEIRRSRFAVLDRRARVSTGKKLRIAASVALGTADPLPPPQSETVQRALHTAKQLIHNHGVYL